jgi:FkbM family methyltransferase
MGSQTMSIVRRAARALVPSSTYDRIKTYLGLSKTRLHVDWFILTPIGPIYRDHVIIDVGAHHGWFFHCWQDWCPGAQVHAFEPFQASFEATKKLYGSDPRVSLTQAGVGAAPGRKSLNVLNESLVSNSFLKPSDATWDAVKYQHGSVTQVEVPVVTLDEYAADKKLNSVYLLKIDVQGFELEVLRGATNLLPRVDHIFVEAGIQRLYENAARFDEVFAFLADAGFHLMTMRAWHRGNHVLMETDMLFRRNGLEGTVDESIVRTTSQLA